MALEIAVLVSIGRHPASGRARRAEADARAVELALGIRDARVRLIHAGDAREPALRDYLGMGISELTVLDLPPGADPVPSLVDHLKETEPPLVLAGQRAEAGEDSGLVPYFVAERLGYAIVPAVVGVALDGPSAKLAQALPRGRRRSLEARLPLVTTVPIAAPPARMSAFGPARRGRIEIVPARAVMDSAWASWDERPARKRPKRLKVMTGGSAADRIRRVTEMQTGKGRVLRGLAPEDAARAILDYLVEEGMLAPAGNRAARPDAPGS